jgi:hypothetical protein
VEKSTVTLVAASSTNGSTVPGAVMRATCKTIQWRIQFAFQ